MSSATSITSIAVATVVVCAISAWLVVRTRKQVEDDHATNPIEVQPMPKQDPKDVTLDLAVSKCKACKELSAAYQKMEDDFVSTGLNTGAIRSMQPWFHGTEGNDTPWPLRYENFPEPIANTAVRLLVIPLDSSPSLASAASAITRDVLKALPESVKAFSNARTQYHCTIFHSSHPTDTRPDPFAPDGGLDAAQASASPASRPTPSRSTLAAEVAAISQLVAGTGPPTLVVDRVLMANSGTLLITWVDPTARVAELRRQLKQALPGACGRQSTIIHTSLLRVVSDQQFSPSTVRDVAEVCERWTKKLRGRHMQPTQCWWVYEHEFSTIAGEKMHMNYLKG